MADNKALEELYKMIDEGLVEEPIKDSFQLTYKGTELYADLLLKLVRLIRGDARYGHLSESYLCDLSHKVLLDYYKHTLNILIYFRQNPGWEDVVISLMGLDHRKDLETKEVDEPELKVYNNVESDDVIDDFYNNDDLEYKNTLH